MIELGGGCSDRQAWSPPLFLFKGGEFSVASEDDVWRAVSESQGWEEGRALTSTAEWGSAVDSAFSPAAGLLNFLSVRGPFPLRGRWEAAMRQQPF